MTTTTYLSLGPKFIRSIDRGLLITPLLLLLWPGQKGEEERGSGDDQIRK